MSRGTKSGRRGFLRALGRTWLAVGLSGGVGALVLRDRGACDNRGLCHGCPALKTCGLPLAVRAREHEEEQAEVD